jgi:MFS family permease
MTPAREPTPIEILRRPGVALWMVARLTSGTAATMLRAAYLWQVYALSGSKAVLGLMGLLMFIPAPFASLAGGAMADAYDRRKIVLAAQSIAFVASAVLTWLAATDQRSLPLLLGFVVLNSIAFAFEAPARQSVLPGLVEKHELSRAVTVFAVAIALAFVTGPAIGGLIIGFAGVPWAYGTAASLFVVALVTSSRVRPRQAIAAKQSVSVAGLIEGFRFVWREKPVLAALSLDLFAVIFGGATALLPVYATDILHVGPKGYGVLASSLEIGALAMSALLVIIPPIKRLGRAVVVSVIAYGTMTILFGLSRSFPLTIAAYIAVGMADQVSVVCRSTLVQMSTPDELRGRVSSVNMVFIGASNHLGAAEAGFVAALTSPTIAVAGGGAMVLVVVAIVVLLIPQLLPYRIATSRPQ